jgi:DNA-binding NarL/FixJ family response regulator
MLLESTGEAYHIEQFYKGEDFMDRLDLIEDEMDIAVVDINMPNFDVIKAVEKIDRNFPMAYIVVASGDDNPELISHLQNTYHTWAYVIKNKNFSKDFIRVISDAHRKVVYRKEMLERVRNHGG